MNDRASVTATAIFQIFENTLHEWLHAHAPVRSIRREVEALLRDEFDAAVREGRAELPFDD
jgi:hypothetical protein